MKSAFSYYKCQACAAKVHCDDCAQALFRILRSTDGIDEVEIDIQKKMLKIEGSIDLDELEYVLEDEGVFLE